MIKGICLVFWEKDILPYHVPSTENRLWCHVIALQFENAFFREHSSAPFLNVEYRDKNTEFIEDFPHFQPFSSNYSLLFSKMINIYLWLSMTLQVKAEFTFFPTFIYLEQMLWKENN